MNIQPTELTTPSSNVGGGFSIEETSIQEFDRLSIAQVERMGDLSNLWVLNTSSGNYAGAISFTADDGREQRGLEVPYTFVAVNLAESMSPKHILGSNSFRRAVSRGFLTIVTEGRAALQNSGESAKIEIEKIRQGISVGVSESAETMASSNPLAPKITVSTGSLSRTGSIDSNLPSKYMVDSRIQSIMFNESISEEEKLNLLRSNKENIKLVDALFIRRCATADDLETIVIASRKMLKTLKSIALGEDANINWNALVEEHKPYARRAMMGG